jgi:NAD(P)-dependent dehydrogenase (short-subunit alcohol dehydrogenase family)
MGKLEGKVAIVTGASRGIGKAIAVEFAKEGVDIAVVGRTVEPLKSGLHSAKLFGSTRLNDIIITTFYFNCSLNARFKTFPAPLTGISLIKITSLIFL